MSIDEILITDYHCASNRGDAAILEGELEVFGTLFPEAEISVMTEYPESAEVMHGISAISQHITPFEPEHILKSAATAYGVLDAAVTPSWLQLPFGQVVRSKLSLQPYYDADAIISTGGQFITDAYYPGKMGVLAGWYIAHQLDTPFAIYAQSLGPVSAPYRKITQSVMDHAEVIITRDRQSKQNLDNLGVLADIHVGVDAAWTMNLDTERPLERGVAEIPDSPENPNGPVVSISARRWSYFDSDDGEQQYFQALAETASNLIQTQDATVIFLSTCTGLGGYHTDDRLAALQVREKMDEGMREHTRIVTEEMTPRQLVAAYENVDLHIGTRMHSCILAMLAKTPVIPIEYQFKTGGMMAQFGLEEYVVGIDKLTSEELLAAIESVQNDYEEFEELIEKTLPELKERAWETARLVKERITKSPSIN